MPDWLMFSGLCFYLTQLATFVMNRHKVVPLLIGVLCFLNQLGDHKFPRRLHRKPLKAVRLLGNVRNIWKACTGRLRGSNEDKSNIPQDTIPFSEENQRA